MNGNEFRQRLKSSFTWPLWYLCISFVCLAGTRMAVALPVGGIVNIQPQVEVRTEKKGWSVAGERYSLAYGEYIRTDKGGKADVLFNNGTEITMHGNTQIQIVAPASTDKPLVVRVFGALSEIFVRAKGNTEIRTAAGNAAVRGTEFLIRLPAEDRTTLTVLEGVVDFSNHQGSVTVTAQQQSSARVGEPPTPPITVDASGLITWTADVTGLPVEFETPMGTLDPATLAQQRKQGEADIAAQPGDAAAHRRYGSALYDSGAYMPAVHEFTEATRLAPADAGGFIELGTALRGSGDPIAAKQAFTHALELAPDNMDARVGLALAAMASGDYPAAHSQLDATTGDARVNAMRGMLALREGNPEQAVPLLTTAVTQDTSLYQTYALLALARLTLNQMPEAEAAARKAVALQPNSAQTQATLAMVLFFEQKEREATAVADLATRIDPYSPFALLTQGRVLLAQDRVDDARNAFQQASARAPDFPLIYTELGQVYLRLGLLPKAETAFRKALAFHIVSADAHAGLGVCLQMQGKTQEAIAEHQRALAIDPRNVSARVSLAALYTEQGQLGKAEEQLHLGVTEQPGHGMLYARLAIISLYRQRLFEAMVFAQQAVSLLPNSAIAHFVLGQVYQEQGRTVQAGDQFRLAATLDPQYAAARYALGVITASTEAGTDLVHPLSAFTAAEQGTSAQNFNLQNLQSPGAQDRIQAAIQDPTVVRVATRSFGDTQIDGSFGEEDTQHADLSYLHESDNQRGVIGLSAQHDSTDGVRANADNTDDQFGLNFGMKAADNPSGLFTMAQFSRMTYGNDVGLTSDPLLATSRTHAEHPSLLLGGTLQFDASQRTSVLVQGERPYGDDTDMMGGTESTLRSLHGEIRHDIISDNNQLSVGVNNGYRDQRADSLLLGIPDLQDPEHPDGAVYAGQLESGLYSRCAGDRSAPFCDRRPVRQ